jgi:hypothetical protein
MRKVKVLQWTGGKHVRRVVTPAVGFHQAEANWERGGGLFRANAERGGERERERGGGGGGEREFI